MVETKKDKEHPRLQGTIPKAWCPHATDNKNKKGLRYGCKFDKSDNLYFWPCPIGNLRGCPYAKKGVPNEEVKSAQKS